MGLGLIGASHCNSGEQQWVQHMVQSKVIFKKQSNSIATSTRNEKVNYKTLMYIGVKGFSRKPFQS